MKKIIIIGAGIAGLTAGIYGRLNGFETEIYEMHSIPGGECTGWNRGDYHFDGCIHWLMGSKKGGSLNKVWREIGALDDEINIINHDYFYQYEEGEKKVKIYRDVDRLEEHLLDIAPEDAEPIKEMCKAIRSLANLAIPIAKPLDMFGVFDGIKMGLKMVPIMGYLQKYNSMSISELLSQFKNPLLRKALDSKMPLEYNATAFLTTLGSLYTGDSGWPAGGSLALSKRVEKKYLSLGGKVSYKLKVDKIIIDNGKATGIKLVDGREIYGDIIISAADGHATLFDMLDGKYLDDTLRTLYVDQVTYPINASILVSIGVATDLSNQPHSLTYTPSKAIVSGGVVYEKVSFSHYCYEPSFAPKGKSVVNCFLYADYDWWREKYKDKEVYRREKEQLAAEVCAVLEERFPEVKGKIEKVDVATPMTYVRYCNAWRGAWMSWTTTPKSSVRFLSGILPGLSNFYMAGQWNLPPGGLPGAVITGRWVIQRICKNEGRKFNS